MSKLKSYILLFIFAAIAVALWDTAFIYPVKLFVVFMHEISHGIAAVLTGGEIIRMEVNQQLGGVCHTRGGSPFFVASAGYLGSIFWGGIILLLATRTRGSQIGSSLIGIALIGITVLYVRNLFGIVSGIVFGMTFILLARYFSSKLNRLVLQFLGIVSCLYVLVDIKQDLFSPYHPVTDAKILASITPFPAIVWAVIWMAISFIILGFAIKYSHSPAPDSESSFGDQS